MESWNAMDTSSIACLIIQTPNYHGLIEDGTSIANAVHNSGAKLIASCNPIALGLLEPQENLVPMLQSVKASRWDFLWDLADHILDSWLLPKT